MVEWKDIIFGVENRLAKKYYVKVEAIFFTSIEN